MLSLPLETDKLCADLFMQCDQFDRDDALRAVFVTEDLAPFASGLPKMRSNKRDFVSRVKLFLLEKRLQDGRVLLLPFLATLLEYYAEADALHSEIVDLHKQILAVLQSDSSTPPLSLNHHYICYETSDGNQFAHHLYEALQAAGESPWLDQYDIPADYDRNDAREEALRECATVLLILTADSSSVNGVSVSEWRKALQYKKPIIPLRFTPNILLPLLLGERTAIDFTNSFENGMGNLIQYLATLSSPVGQLHELKYRLADAGRELRDSPNNVRILQDIEQLEKQIETQRTVVYDPQAAEIAAKERTDAALERERQPDRPATGRAQTKFINPPPLTAPIYFQDRHNESELIADFLRDPAVRLLTVVGRGGVGKTAMVCRLLKSLHRGQLPDDLGEFPVSGIVYLSAVGSHRISFPNLFADLLRLLPTDRAKRLSALYADPQKSVTDKMIPLLEAFTEEKSDPSIILLDNLEDLLDPVTNAITESEVDSALRVILEAFPHPLKVLLTTRVTPKEIVLLHPERQFVLPLDEGLPPPFAVKILRAGDRIGVLGLKDASDEELAPACEYTRGYPRALEALTAALNADRATSLDDLLAGPAPINVVDALVGEAYSRLDPVAQKVMQALAIFGRPVPSAAVDYLVQPYLPSLDSTPVLNRLVNMHFVTKEAGHYYMHPVDRTHVLQRLTLDPGVTKLQIRAADYFYETRLPRADWRTLEDLSPQLAEIELRYAVGDYDSAARVLSEISYGYLRLWGHYQLLLGQHERVQGKLSDGTQRMDNQSRLGQTYWAIGQPMQAIICHEEALEISREIGNSQWEGVSLGNLGNDYKDIGKMGEAIKYYEEAIEISREIGDREGEGTHLGNLGNAYKDIGKVREAIEYYEEALEISREFGDREGEGANLGNLGGVLTDIGKVREAIKYYEEALEISREIGDRQNEGIHLGNLGIANGELGNLGLAITYLEQALAISGEIGYKYIEGVVLGDLALVLIDDNRYLEAVVQAQASVDIAIDTDNVQVGCVGNYALALAYFFAYDLLAARAAAEQALGYHFPTMFPEILALQGLVNLQLRDPLDAHKSFTTALAHAEALLEDTSDNSAMLDTKALALVGLDEIEDAKITYQTAREINSNPGTVQRANRLLDQLEEVPKFWEE